MSDASVAGPRAPFENFYSPAAISSTCYGVVSFGAKKLVNGGHGKESIGCPRTLCDTLMILAGSCCM